MPSEILASFGCTIRKIRQSRNMSQEALADLCGLHRTYISDVELGKRNVSLENIDKMAAALAVPLPELFEGVVGNASV